MNDKALLLVLNCFVTLPSSSSGHNLALTDRNLYPRLGTTLGKGKFISFDKWQLDSMCINSLCLQMMTNVSLKIGGDNLLPSHFERQWIVTPMSTDLPQTVLSLITMLKTCGGRREHVFCHLKSCVLIVHYLKIMYALLNKLLEQVPDKNAYNIPGHMS